MVDCLICLGLACVFLALLLYEERRHRQFYEQQAKSYRDRLFVAWEENRRLMALLDDSGDWWKAGLEE